MRGFESPLEVLTIMASKAQVTRGSIVVLPAVEDQFQAHVARVVQATDDAVILEAIVGVGSLQTWALSNLYLDTSRPQGSSPEAQALTAEFSEAKKFGTRIDGTPMYFGSSLRFLRKVEGMTLAMIQEAVDAGSAAILSGNPLASAFDGRDALNAATAMGYDDLFGIDLAAYAEQVAASEQKLAEARGERASANGAAPKKKFAGF